MIDAQAQADELPLEEWERGARLTPADREGLPDWSNNAVVIALIAAVRKQREEIERLRDDLAHAQVMAQFAGEADAEVSSLREQKEQLTKDCNEAEDEYCVMWGKLQAAEADVRTQREEIERLKGKVEATDDYAVMLNAEKFDALTRAETTDRRVEELERALRPFAEIVDDIWFEGRTEPKLVNGAVIGIAHDGKPNRQVTHGDFFRARELLIEGSSTPTQYNRTPPPPPKVPRAIWVRLAENGNIREWRWDTTDGRPQMVADGFVEYALVRPSIPAERSFVPADTPVTVMVNVVALIDIGRALALAREYVSDPAALVKVDVALASIRGIPGVYVHPLARDREGETG